MSDAHELNTAIAIIGIGCRFPDARNPIEFWNNLAAGHESLRALTDDELRDAGVDAATRALPNFVGRGAILENIDLFDARLFGFNAREAQILDPQQRIFLECAWEALEDAGLDPSRYHEPIGVFAGADQSGYQFNIYSNPEVLAAVGQFAVTLANDKDHLTTRTAYTLNLKGPAVTVQTNCSTSLVAVCQACQSLLNYQCDVALAGGSAIAVPQGSGYFWREGGIESPDGHCRTFDAKAQGTVGGSGAGIVVLKRYDAALADRDNIYAVIRGFGMNNDGGNKVSYTAPGIEGQSNAIRSALAMAEVEPESITYIEAHGTGTPLGDPIEIAALTGVFQRQATRTQFCGIGSVKTNVGHLGSAAGVAGLIKTALALKNKKLPPSLHYSTSNPAIDFESSPFFVVDSLRDWKNGAGPRRAGVSSFGVGGTNAHVVVEEAPVIPDSEPGRDWQVLPLSAKTTASLDRMTENLIGYLRTHPDANLADVAHTLQNGRREFAQRRVLVATTGDHMEISGSGAANRLPVTMLFPGQGSQHVGMAAELYRAEPVFRDCIDTCSGILLRHLGSDLREILNPRDREDAAKKLSQTAVAQPALFVVEYALARLWMDWGVRPEAMAGHSIGEYVAACLAGVFTLEDALALVAERGRLMQSMPQGAMLVVYRHEDTIRDLLVDGLSLAAANGPEACVVAGGFAAIEKAQEKLTARAVAWKRLPTSHAFHSASMEPIVDVFVNRVREVDLNAPVLPYLSNLTGTWITAAQAIDPQYWGQHLRQTVRFRENVQALHQLGDQAFLETGPGLSLATLARAGVNGNRSLALSSLPGPRSLEPALKIMMQALGHLWVNGAEVDWLALHRGEKRRRISLPYYPFDRQRYWVNRISVEQRIARDTAPALETIVPESSGSPSSHINSRPALATPYVAPRNPTEEAIAALWSDALGLDRVGVDDNFLDCGGHSLLAVQMISRLRDLLRVEVSIAGFFDGPTVAELALRVRDSKIARAPLVPQSRPERIPLSYSQQRLWFIDQLEGASAEYNLPEALRLRGTLDVPAMRRSINAIVERHESLRTTFVEVDGDPVQRIVPSMTIDLPVEDLRGMDEPAQLKAVTTALRREWAEPFNLSRGPLLRTKLLQLGEQDHILLRTCHHIVSDAWSIDVFNREFTQIYNALVEGREHPLSPLPVQYADYALWQRGWFDADAIALSLGYWKQQLAGLPERIELPTDRPRPAVQTYAANICSVKLEPKYLRSLERLGQDHQATLYMTLLAAFAVLLERSSCQGDLAISSPVANRQASQLEGLIGFFVNSLVMRVRVDLKSSFIHLLSAVRRMTLDAYEHQDIPFERLVEELAPVRSLSQTPLSQVVFALQNAPAGVQTLTGLEAESISGGELRVRFDLEVHAVEHSGALHLHWIYNRDLFDDWRIEQMAHHFLRLLEIVVARPEVPLYKLDLLTPSERSLLLDRSEGMHQELTAELLPEQFERQAELRPDALAVICGGESITYGELNARANRLAHALIARGVGPGRIVGISLPRSVEMVVALLATLKAGGAYLPLDPGYPQARLAAMVADASPVLVLGRESLNSRELPAGNLQSRVSPHHPAYVIYTSGSTGVPKGVVIRHGELLNYLSWAGALYETTTGCGAPVNTPLAFDATVSSLWLPLLSGKTVFLVPEEGQIEALGELLAEGHEFTLVKLTPAHLTALADYLGPRATSVRARIFVVGGEALKSAVANFWTSHVSGLRIVNEYGPTETVVGCCVHVLQPGEQSDGDVPIGVPVANTRLYVLDGTLESVSVGVWGELYIGGSQLGAGYLHRGGLTASRFVADPLGEPGTLMYRTGDSVRWLRDGTLEFQGRTDQQIKIRGFRVEPGEIESVLTEQPQVAQAIVIARDDDQQGPKLVAYIVAVDGASPDFASLRKLLSGRLPDYMVPSAFVTIPALPLTPNGKIDRRSLPSPARNATGFRAPTTPVEEILCGLFAEVLHRERIGIGDDFFVSGGHSLLAIRLISRIRGALQVELPIRALFESPTVAELASRLRGADAARAPLVRQPRNSRLPLSYAQQRLWFLHRMEGPGATYNIPLALRFEGHLDVTALKAALCDIAARHESLRTIFPDHDGVAYQHILSPDDAAPAFIVEDIAESELAARLRQSAARGGDLTREIPLQVSLFRLNPRRYVLLLVLHHIAGDAWSLNVLLRDLATAYAARSRAVAPVFEELSIQYADYTLWQRQLLGDERDPGSLLHKQLGFWRTALADAPHEISLPTDHPRPTAISYRGSSLPVRLDPVLHGNLLQLGRACGASLFMVLQAGFAALLSRLGAGDDILIGTVIAGRGEAALEDQVGPFLNTLALRTNLSGSPGFRELIGRVRAFDLEAYGNQDVPFERVVETLHPERSMARHPLFQVAFTLQNVPPIESSVSDLVVHAEPLTSEVAKFDLLLGLQEYYDEAGQPAGMEGALEYSLDLFERPTIEAMVSRLVTLLQAAISAPDVSVHRLNILSSGEQHLLLEEFNRTASVAPEATLPQLFEEQAARRPEACAVIFGEERVTYGELNLRANRLAHHLIGLGVGPGILVGIALERSVAMIVAILGVVKAGGAWIPLDPSYPEARLAYMRGDAAPALILDSLLDLKHAADSNPVTTLRQEDLAYVIYTSGSTGEPKGVAVTHAGIYSLVRTQIERLGVTPESRVLQFSSLSFDASVYEIVMALAVGAMLVLIAEDERIGLALRDVLVNRRITHATLPPAVLATLEDGPGLFLQGLTVAGEACSAQLAAAWSANYRMVNAYGPTETTVCATMSAPLAGSGAPPIGSPIFNTRVYVLDPALQPVPVGVAGEIYIAGASLARGYLGRPAITAERFVADPHAMSPGGRMYRTGDRARWRADGMLDFLGRADRQLKVRGIRIEPGEIEGALVSFAGIAQAAVIARESEDSATQLVAYIVPAGASTLDVETLRQAMQEQLPASMVPSAFVIIDALPLTPNGKLDERALPAPEYQAEGYRAPRTSTEQTLCDLFASILSLDRVGIDESFFGLGGDSIMSIQLVSRARKSGLELTARDVFQWQTVRALAAVARVAPLERQKWDPASGVGEVIATPVIRWFFERGGPVRRFNQSMLLQVPEDLLEAHLLAALQALLDTHDVLRLRLEPGRRLKIGPRGSVAAVNCLMQVPLKHLDTAALEAEDRLAPEIGSVIQAVWSPGRLLLVIHHLCVDAISWRILVEDLVAAWRAAKRGEAAVLESGIPFRLWARHLAEQAETKSVVAELPAWKAILNGGDPLLPGATLDPVRDTFATVGHLHLELPAQLTSRLLTAIPAAFHARVNDVLLAALARAVAAWRMDSGSILIDLEGHGREPIGGDLDLSRTVGWFTNLFPVALDIGTMDIAEGLKRVKEQLRSIPGSGPERGLGYGLLRYLNPVTAPDLAAMSRPQIGFNYLGRFSVGGTMGDGWPMAPDVLSLSGGLDATFPLFHVVDINARTLDGPDGPHLSATWTWASRLLADADARALAAEWVRALEDLASHVESSRAGGHTPSDFPLVRLSQAEVERLETMCPGLEDVLPLTPLQHGLRFHTLYDDDAPDVYTVQITLELEGELESERMRLAAQSLIDRHASLRVGFRTEGFGLPVQVISRGVTVPWREVDFSGLHDPALAAQRTDLLAQERATRFVPSESPLLRFTLARIDGTHHILVFTGHHLLMDGWSMPVFFSDLFALYRSFGDDRALPPVRPYADYLAWLAAQDKEVALAVWRDYLAGLDGSTLLVPSRSANLVLTVPETHWASLSPQKTAQLKSFARERGLTVNTVVQAMWAVLIGRMTGRQDVVYGVTVSGRPAELAGVEHTVGLFINTIPLRARLLPGQTVAALLHEIQDGQTRLLPYHYVGLADIQHETAAPQLFDTLVGFQNYPVDRAALAETTADLRVSGFEGQDATHYPLIMMVMPGEQLFFRIDYAPAFLDRRMVECLGACLVRLMTDVVERPQARLHELQFFSDDDRERLLRKFNDTGERTLAATVTGLFELQVARHPQRTALVYEGESLSYEQLNGRANRIAHRLIEVGVGPDCLVGICIDRSIDMIVGLIGILKAGGAYLPIDADLPTHRRQEIIRALRHVVTTDTHRALFANTVEHIVTDGAPRTGNPAVRLAPSNLAYVNYTSGSTGLPKGVLVPHTAIARLVIDPNYVTLNESSRLLQMAPISFDAATFEIWGALLNGGALVIMPPGTVSLDEIGDTVSSAGVNTMWLTSGLFNQAVENILPALSGVRQLLAGGDVLSPDHVRKIQQVHAACEVINGYGPTENTTFTCCYRVTNGTDLNHGVPIGSPIRGTSVYVLDSALNPAPVGTTGELYAAGAGLARGYFNQPALTAERFVADPHAPEPGGRMYRTGDLARWREDGTLDFLGRTDRQVKLRGFRIEPGEIEAALRSHERVQDALVMVDRRDDKQQLLAYVINHQSQDEEAEARTSHIEMWRQLYESTYADTPDLPDDFNVTGWNSSYTGEPIPAAEMRIWVDETVARLRTLNPRRVLEIGCGSGLLLTRLAPDCESYLGLDFSAQVLGQLGGYIAHRQDLAHVKLRQGLANDLKFLEDGSVDLVVLNSIVQYFPGLDYLLDVLGEAARVVMPGGHIFVGDLRSLPLLEAFHTSVELHRAPGTINPDELRQRVALAIRNERELLVDAALFEELGLGRVETWLKAGDYDNELSRFRYDVIIRLGVNESVIAPRHLIPWDAAGAWSDAVNELLTAQPGSTVAVTRIRDRRVANAVAAAELLQPGADAGNTADLRSAAARDVEDPDAVVHLARRLGADFLWRGFGADGVCQAVFNPKWGPSNISARPARAALSRFANSPARGSGEAELSRELLDYLRGLLPDYMIPAAILLLPCWPLTPNGKVDRHALPLPGGADSLAKKYEGPRSVEENILCRLFAEVLSLPKVGIHDNFFELGGHSLLVMQLCARVHATFGVKLNIRTIFEAPGVAELARHLSGEGPATTGFERVLPLRSQGSQAPLFCLPPGGGLSWSYAGLMFEIDPERPIYGLQTPGIAADETLAASIEQMAEEFLLLLRRIQPAGPYHLLGWSLGGQLAFHMACLLRDAGEEIDLLAILDSFPFTNASDMRLPEDHEVLERIVEQAGLDKTKLAKPLTMQVVFEAMRSTGHVLTALEVDQAERMLKLMKHHALLCSRFRPSYFDGDLLLFVASEGRGDGPPFPEEWAPHVGGRIETHPIHCRHEAMDQPGPLSAIGRILERRLRSQKGSRTWKVPVM